MRYRTLSALLLVGASSLTLAQEPPEGCDQIMEYFNKGDIDGAKKEAEWCLQALEQLGNSKTVRSFARRSMAGNGPVSVKTTQWASQ